MGVPPRIGDQGFNAGIGSDPLESLAPLCKAQHLVGTRLKCARYKGLCRWSGIDECDTHCSN